MLNTILRIPHKLCSNSPVQLQMEPFTIIAITSAAVACLNEAWPIMCKVVKALWTLAKKIWGFVGRLAQRIKQVVNSMWNWCKRVCGFETPLSIDKFAQEMPNMSELNFDQMSTEEAEIKMMAARRMMNHLQNAADDMESVFGDNEQVHLFRDMLHEVKL